jgi:uncharacterized protein (TIGR02677 family)
MSAEYSVFAHLTTEKSALYRSILDALVAERARFAVALRPGEIYAAIASRWTPSSASSTAPPALPTADPLPVALPALEDIETGLRQLREWGNLDDAPDTAHAATIEEFYRQRRLYQLSAAGEAAERALTLFREHLARPGELQTTALHDILGLLDQLPGLLAQDPIDEARIHLALTQLAARFEELTTRAQSFMRDLQRRIDLHGLSVADFLAYKERLIDYLERFIGELAIATNRIAESLHALPPVLLDAAFAVTARRETADALDAGPAASAAAEMRWRDRWQGLRRWFIGDGAASHAELLRARARSAIPALLSAVSQINERRASRTDRAADFSALARWFAAAPDDAAAHRLWRAAFALSPARHLRLNEETLSLRRDIEESQRLSWLEAPPMWLSARLRQSGRHARGGAAPATIDRSREKAQLVALAREQAEQLEQARNRFLHHGRCRLGELGPLDEIELSLFLDLLGQALVRQRHAEDSVHAVSADGSLRIRLDPVPDGIWIEVPTSDGCFRGRDHWIAIESTGSASR